MRTLMAGLAERRRPLRSRHDDPVAPFRRGELAAGLATAVIVGQLVLAPVILCAAAVLVVVGRLSRWRPHWLTAPIIASLLWLRADGLRPAAAGVAEGAQRASALLLVAAVHPSRLAHSVLVLAGAATWLRRQLPLAMLTGAVEAGLVLWLGWWRRTAQPRLRPQSLLGPQPRSGLRSGSGSAAPWQWRPGLVAVLRRQAAMRDLAAGHTVSVDGCTLGVVTETGKLAGLSWAEVARGVMLAGADADDLGLAITCAALRLRKTVVVVGAVHDAGVARRVRDLATSLGVPAAESGLGSGDGAAGTAAVIGQAIRGRTLALVMTPTVAAAERAVGDLTRVLADLRSLGLRADCIAWLAGGEAVDWSGVPELLALGQLTGTAVLLSTPDPGTAGTMACSVGTIVVGGPVAIGREGAHAAQLAAACATWRPISRERGQFSVVTRVEPPDAAPRITTGCVVVPMTAEPQR